MELLTLNSLNDQCLQNFGISGNFKKKQNSGYLCTLHFQTLCCYIIAFHGDDPGFNFL